MTMSAATDARLLTRKELAAALGRSRCYVHRMQRAGFAFDHVVTLAQAKAWLAENPGFRGTGKKSRKLQKATRCKSNGEVAEVPRDVQLMRDAHDYVGFDYDSVEMAVDGEPHDARADAFEEMARGIGEFCMFLAGQDTRATKAGAGATKALNPETVGLRTIAALWVLRPDAVGALPLLEMSKRLGVSDSILSRYAAQFRDRFGIKGRAQRSTTTRELMKRAHRPRDLTNN